MLNWLYKMKTKNHTQEESWDINKKMHQIDKIFIKINDIYRFLIKPYKSY